MPVSPDMLRQLYVKKSLKNIDGGFELQLTNPLSDATIIRPASVSIGDEKFKDLKIVMESGVVENKSISDQKPLKFLVRTSVTLQFPRDAPLSPDKYTLKFTIMSQEYGELKFSIKDRIRE